MVPPYLPIWGKVGKFELISESNFCMFSCSKGHLIMAYLDAILMTLVKTTRITMFVILYLISRPIVDVE